MEEWIVLERIFSSQDKAQQAAGIIQITEARLSSNPNGPRYEIETEVFESAEGWQVKWQKVFAGLNSGCGNCSSCREDQKPTKPAKKLGKLIEFKSSKK